MHKKLIEIFCALGACLWLFSAVEAQTFETLDFRLKLVKESQTVAALEPKNTPGFDFTPSDRLSQRAANGYHHLGDLILSARVGSSGPWLKYDTAESRARQLNRCRQLDQRLPRLVSRPRFRLTSRWR